MNRSTLLIRTMLALAVAGVHGSSFSQSTDELALCIVFLKSNSPEITTGSGFLIQSNDTPILVTAGHVARQMTHAWTMILQGTDGKQISARLNGVDWRFSDLHDVAILPLHPEDEKWRKSLLNRSIPSRFLTGRDLPPSRDVTLTVMGFPLGLGSEGYVSPLSLETKAASGFVTLERADTRTVATFILLQDPSIGGLSGGPVFDTGLNYFAPGRQIKVREGLSIVGLIHGEVRDSSVGKLTAVVPATEITSLLLAEGFR